MLRSRSNALVGVRRVAEQNTGRNTAGMDGVAALLAETRSELAQWVQQRSASWPAAPVRRVFIPKANGKQRLSPPTRAPPLPGRASCPVRPGRP